MFSELITAIMLHAAWRDGVESAILVGTSGNPEEPFYMIRYCLLGETLPCPSCGGKGYHGSFGGYGISAGIAEICRPCNGTGEKTPK